MSLNFNLSELIADPDEWAKCPKCLGNAILVGGQLSCCAECSFMGSYRDIKQTQLLQYARAKLSSRQMGHRGVLAVVRGEETKKRAELVSERASQLAQRIIHASHFDHAVRQTLTGETFNPVVVHNYRPEDHQDAFLSFSEEDRTRILMKVQRSDVASIVWHGKIVKDFFESDQDFPKDEGHSVVVINTHFYNAPSHVRAVGIDWKGGKPSLGKVFPESNDLCPTPLIWQPVYWPILTIVPGRVQPRYFAALEVEDDVNINLSVCEDMDGPPLVRSVIRKPWSLDVPVVKDYECSDAEEGVAMLKEKFAKVSDELGSDAGPLIFKRELEWDGEEHPWIISYRIRKDELWTHYQKLRK